jgi:hypothetical protein
LTAAISLMAIKWRRFHFHSARSGDCVTRMTAIGPLGIEYVDLGDDPRQLNRG